MGKININGVETLGNLKVNGREYAFGLQGNNLDYYERQSNEFGYTYVASKKDYTLEGNAGTSLTKLNERIFMQHIADKLKNDIKIGSLNGKEEIEKNISLMQQVIDEEGPEKIKQLFKGDVKNIDEESLVANSEKLISYLETKRKALSKDKIDFIDGGVSKNFVNTNPNLNRITPETKIDDEFEVLSPTIIVDKLVKVPKKEIVEETKKEEPSPAIMGVKESDLSNDVIKRILEEKQDRITKEQGQYLEKILDSREEVNQEEFLPKVDVEPTKEFTPKKEFDLEQTITSLEEFKKAKEEVVEEKEEVEPEEKGKQKSLGKISHKAAYVDTVILCLLVQLGIFGLLIFVLLLIK